MLKSQPKSQPNSWQAMLKLINQCPVCHTPYGVDSARLFAAQGKTHLVHITCAGCLGYFLTMIMEMGVGISSVGTVTDLSYDDLKRIGSAPAISLDEVIDAHQYINQNFPAQGGSALGG
jgi:hypothetical protein